MALPRERPTDVVHAARHAVADLLLRALVATGERPSPEHVAYLRPFVEDAQEYEIAVLRRLDSLAPLPPVLRPPVPVVRRIEAPKSPIRRKAKEMPLA